VPATKLKTFDPRNAKAWRAWQDAVDETLSYGWVDSLIRRLDDDRNARKFTPRRADSA